MKIFLRIHLKIFILSVSCSLLNACNSKNDNTDLTAYVNQLKKKSEQVSARPINTEIIKPITYQAKGIRAPFLSEIEAKKLEVLEANVKTPLESFPLDAMQFIGIVAQENNELWAVIATPDHKIYQIGKGTPIGENQGRIIKITSNELQVNQLVSDEAGNVLPRIVILRLKEGK